MGDALHKAAPRLHKKAPAITVPQTNKRIVAIKNAKAAGQMFYATGGQHLNSDEFFQAQEHSKRLDEAKKLLEVKENWLLLQQTEKRARNLLAAKCPLNEETFKKYNKPDIKVLCKWKGIKVKADKKEEMFTLYNSAPEPPLVKPWSEEEESDLLELVKPNMPLEQTHLGVAARQMAVATANNMARLDEDTRHQLLQSLATFDHAQHSTP